MHLGFLKNLRHSTKFPAFFTHESMTVNMAAKSLTAGQEGESELHALVDELLKHCVARCDAAGQSTVDALNAMLQKHTQTTGEAAHVAQPSIIKVPMSAPAEIVPVDMRYRGCLMGLAIGDAIGVANGQNGGSGRAGSLNDLNAMLGDSHDPLHVQFQKGKRVQLVGGGTACGMYGIAVGGWSHLTASCLAAVQSILQTKGIDTRDMMMRLLRLCRTGKGSCVPGHSAGIDKASSDALEMFERQGTHSPALHGCSSRDAANSAALARVPPVVLYMCRSSAIEAVVGAAAENTRATVGLPKVSGPAPSLPLLTPCSFCSASTCLYSRRLSVPLAARHSCHVCARVFVCNAHMRNGVCGRMCVGRDSKTATGEEKSHGRH